MFNPTRHLWRASFMLLLLSAPGFAQTQPASADGPVSQLKAQLAASQASLRRYTWIETTSVLLNGDEKSNKQRSCYYGADGKLQKVEIASSPEPRQKRGLRGAIIESKKEELTDYMQNAVALVRTYLPPEPNAIQASVAAGRVSVDVLVPGRRARLNFQGYHKPGDKLAVDFDLVARRPLSFTVSTYLDGPKDAVTLSATMGQLDDGTTYVASTTVDAAAKNLKVTVQNGGYRKLK